MKLTDGPRLALALILTTLAAAPARAGAPVWEGHVDDTLARLEPARQRASSVRSELDAGGVEAAVRAAAAAAGRDLPPLPPAPQGSALARLAAAVRGAEGMLPAPGALPRDWGSVIANAFARPHGAHPRPVDPGPALRAARHIARAVDAALAAPIPVATGSGAAAADAECDVVDQPGLCVGGAGANRYDTDRPLIVDLGGADVYTNSAGGGSALSATPVSVVVDLAGDDRYEAPSRAPIAQGAGVAGVGILVDAAGNDVYRAARTDTTGTLQGFAVLGGFGLLQDLAGDDVYEASTTAAGANASIQAQGVGAAGGIGALVDVSGDDRYDVHATSIPVAGIETDDEGNERPVTYSGYGWASGHGIGAVGGAALLADAEGNDTYRVAGVIGPADPGAPVSLGPGDWSASGDGQGAGVLAGAGILLEGTGDDTYDLIATAGPLPSSERAPRVDSFGQGAASVGAIAILEDGAGHDAYTVSVAAEASVLLEATDGCVCEAPLKAIAGQAHLQAQGQGLDGAVGLLEDGGGRDAVAASAVSDAKLVVADRRTTTDVLAIEGDAVAGAVGTYVQGAGLGPGGVGAVVNRLGSDTYTASNRSVATADGSSELAANDPALFAAPGPVRQDAQGVGVGSDLGNLVVGPGTGLLLDLGARDVDVSSDRYTTVAEAREAVDGEWFSRPVTTHVQGAADSGFGVAALGLAVDLGVAFPDVYEQTPPSRACVGTRGQGVWADCGAVGIGVRQI